MSPIRAFAAGLVMTSVFYLLPTAEPIAETLQPAASVESQVAWVWSGAATHNSLRVNARLSADGSISRLVISTGPDLANPAFSGYDTASASMNNRVVQHLVGGLLPNTRYYYSFEVNGVIDSASLGSSHTFPEGTASFTIALASCAATGSQHAVFDTIRNRQPLLFFHLGDMHYQNIGVNDVNIFRSAFEAVLASPPQAALYRSVPLAYIWDDHDFGPNNSDSTAAGRLAARLTYQEYFPHYPLASGAGNVCLSQAFTIGRVRFIVCDSRSARSPASAPDNGAKTMLGVSQKAWFKQQLLSANGRYPLIVWVNTLPWIGATGDDGWHLYTNERRELADFIKTNRIRGLCMISGDAHMLAIDDGSHSDYATGGGAAFPVFHAAALDQSGSVKGGPYSHGAFPGRGQFGLMQVIDEGDSILTVTWSGRNTSGGELVSYSFPAAARNLVCGDANSSGFVNISDAVFVIQFLYNSGPAPTTLSEGDANADLTVALDDAVLLLNHVFLGGAPPACPND